MQAQRGSKRKIVSWSVDREIYDRFVTYCQRHHLIASRIIDDLMERYISENED